VFALYILVDSILGLIVQYIIGSRVCVLVILSNHNLAKYSNMYVQIEIFGSLNYFDQSMIRIKLLKIETLVFNQHKTLSKTNQATIEISCYNP